MARVVILEGPDGGGKTTLANEFVKAGFKYRHEGPPPQGINLIAHYLMSLNDSIESKENIVHDRLWLGERIYGPTVRGVDLIGPRGQILFERLHRSKAIFQYICMPNMEIAKMNYLRKINQQDDYMKSTDYWDKVFKGYAAWMWEHGMGSHHYDYSQTTSGRILSEVMSTQNVLNILPKGTIGSTEAKVIFIGDRPNHSSIDVPFFSLSGSSGYLNAALSFIGFRETDLAFSNAYAPNGNTHLLAPILKQLPKLEHVVLMGKEAENWFSQQMDINDVSRLMVHSVQHPSYMKRFKGHNPQIMANMIQEKFDWHTMLKEQTSESSGTHLLENSSEMVKSHLPGE